MLSMMVVSLSLSATYELADLKALEKQQSWEELVAHLGDVLPSKRDKDWEGLAERGGAAWLGAWKLDTANVSNAEAPITASDDLIKKFPFLKTSKTFMASRANIGLKAFALSFSNYRHSAGDDEWLTKVRAFVESDVVTPDLPTRAAKELVLGRLIPVTAFPLFKLSADRGNKTLCKDADFQKALVATYDDGSWKTEANDLAGRCWDDVKGPLVAALEKAKTNAFRRNLCPVLAGKNALPAAQKDACDRANQ